MTQLSSNDRDRFIHAVRKRGDVRAQLALQWVQNLARIANELVARGTNTSIDTQAAFWIRLHGVLVEVGGNYEYLGNLIGTEPTGDNASCALVVRDAIRATRDALDEDERIWLHYRRDTECHVVPEAYELAVKNGKLKEQRRFALLDQTIHVDLFDKRVRAFLRKYDVNEPAIAVAFAKRLAPLIANILVAMRPLYES